MTGMMWALLLKPLFVLIFFGLIVAPIAWALDRLIPAGPVKSWLFEIRDGPQASRRDQLLMTAGVFVGYAIIFTIIFLLQ